MAALCKDCSNSFIHSTSTLPDIFDRLRAQGISNKTEVSHLIHNAEHDMKSISSKILQLQSIIFTLRKNREQLEKFSVDAASLIAPIRQLPTEILARIFTIICTSTPSFFSTNSQASCRINDAPPFVLSAVCAHWRGVVRNSAILWSNLSLDLRSLKSNRVGPPVEFHLRCSKEHSLSLDIQLHGQGEPLQEHPLMYSIAEHSRRWGDVTIRSRLHSLNFYPSLTSLGPLPFLHSLRVLGQVGEIPRFRNAPLLRVLALDCALVPSRARASFPCEQITGLELDAQNYALFHVPEFFPNLESLSLTGVNHRVRRTPSDLKSQTFNHLRSLSISLAGETESFGYNLLELLLKSLTVPSLTTLAIKSQDLKHLFHGPWPQDHFTGLINRSRCSITTLRLDCIPISDKHLTASLELLPALQDLTILERPLSTDLARKHSTQRLSTITKDFLRDLHRYGHHSTSLLSQRSSSGARESPFFLPRLKRLNLGSVKAVSSQSFDEEAFVSMLVSRWVPDIDDCLRFVSLRLDGTCLSVETRRELEYLQHAGLVVEVFEGKVEEDSGARRGFIPDNWVVTSDSD